MTMFTFPIKSSKSLFILSLLCTAVIYMYTMWSSAQDYGIYRDTKNQETVKGSLDVHSMDTQDDASHIISYKQLNIEKLEPEYHFRKNFYLGRTKDVESKDHLLEFLLGRHVNCFMYPRQILIDLGANKFDSSVGWFITNYPCKFPEIHAFEVKKNIFIIPEKEKARVTLHESFIGAISSETEMDIADFILNALHVKPTDFLVIKMDIEGTEYKLLDYMQSKGIWPLIDELFVELHYKHPYMKRFNWDIFKEHTIEDATNLLRKLRIHGIFAHPWP